MIPRLHDRANIELARRAMVISMLIRRAEPRAGCNWKAYITRHQLGLSLGLRLSQVAGFRQACSMFARSLLDRVNGV